LLHLLRKGSVIILYLTIFYVIVSVGVVKQESTHGGTNTYCG
jgi:hypothetical protein